MNPLVNVLLGVLFLQEKMRFWQWVAVFLTAIGVLVQVLALGEVPLVGLTVAFSFGLYGLVRKMTPVEASVGLLAETVILAVPAALYLAWLAAQGQGTFFRVDAGMDSLLVSLGLVTAMPLIFFAVAVRRLRLSTVGLFQYVIPVTHFLIAVVLYDEHFTLAHGATFAFIWLALGLYSWDGLRQNRKEKLVGF